MNVLSVSCLLRLLLRLQMLVWVLTLGCAMLYMPRVSVLAILCKRAPVPLLWLLALRVLKCAVVVAGGLLVVCWCWQGGGRLLWGWVVLGVLVVWWWCAGGDGVEQARGATGGELGVLVYIDRMVDGWAVGLCGGSLAGREIVVGRSGRGGGENRERACRGGGDGVRGGGG